MTMTAEITKTVKEIREIDLPYHSRSGSDYFRVNADNTIMHMYAGEYWVSMNLQAPGILGYENDLKKALNSEPCSQKDYLAAMEKIRARMEISTTA